MPERGGNFKLSLDNLHPGIIVFEVQPSRWGISHLYRELKSALAVRMPTGLRELRSLLLNLASRAVDLPWSAVVLPVN